MLDAVMLLMVLRRDQTGDVELQPVQIEADAPVNFVLQRRTKVVNIISHGLLEIACLQMHVLNGKAHIHLLIPQPRAGCAALHLGPSCRGTQPACSLVGTPLSGTFGSIALDTTDWSRLERIRNIPKNG